MTKTRLFTESNRTTLIMAGTRLEVVRGPDRGASLRLDKEEVVVGTAASCDLVLGDATVSRSHLVLRVTPDGYVVEDLGSTNGTRIGGRPFGVAWIEPGDRLELGATALRVEADGRPVELELSGRDSFGRLLGQSVAARRLFAVLHRVSASDATVLISGETGTGKDLAAEAIHEASARAAGPFVVVDCSALVGALMESELFGHEKGAFTGADSARAGAFVEASGGTLFLDEVGELPRDLQAKLLGVLERREVRPVGGSGARAVDVRILAATHRDLKIDVNQRRFREDLFYRLNVVNVRMPPLRDRADDVLLLAEHFWRTFRGDATTPLPAELAAALVGDDWPGNVRQLRNRIERAAVLDGIDTADAPASQRTFGAAKA
ncbi:MAG: sigma 54-interacting transcriptional regulator, partial [Myxococcales bacterium]|nr:sigma 54-interacting transcriptional regulator [Myxococcales bacterium]